MPLGAEGEDRVLLALMVILVAMVIAWVRDRAGCVGDDSAAREDDGNDCIAGADVSYGGHGGGGGGGGCCLLALMAVVLLRLLMARLVMTMLLLLAMMLVMISDRLYIYIFFLKRCEIEPFF